MNYKAQNHKTHEKHLCTCARPHTHFRATREDTQLQRYTAIYHRGYPHSCTTIQAQNTPPAINCSNIPHISSQRFMANDYLSMQIFEVVIYISFRIP